jgi:hypothetical protein
MKAGIRATDLKAGDRLAGADGMGRTVKAVSAGPRRGVLCIEFVAGDTALCSRHATIMRANERPEDHPHNRLFEVVDDVAGDRERTIVTGEELIEANESGSPWWRGEPLERFIETAKPNDSITLDGLHFMRLLDEEN